MKRKSAAALTAALFASLALLFPVTAVSAMEVEEESPVEPETSYEEPYEEPSSVEEPSTVEDPSYEEPSDVEEPSSDEEPSYEEPSYEEPSYEEPSYEEPSYEESSYYQEESSYYYEESSYDEPDYEETSFFNQTETPEPSINDSVGESSIENSLLTSEDWNNMQKSMSSSEVKKSNSSSANQDFADIKEHKDDGKSNNDTWIYLALGLPLIIVGIGLIAGVIIFNIKANRNNELTETSEYDNTPPVNEEPLQTQVPPTVENNTEDNIDDEPVFSKDAFLAAKAARKSNNSEDSDKFDTLDNPINKDDNHNN